MLPGRDLDALRPEARSQVLRPIGRLELAIRSEGSVVP
jgi:hypothetical protein